MKTFQFPSILLFASLSTAARFSRSKPPPVISNIPGTIVNATSVAQFTTEEYGFDGPKVRPLNGTAVDWWYFDVVSPDAKMAVVIVFQMQAAIIGDGVHELAVDIDATFPNGTTVSALAVASSAVVTTVEQGSSGVFVGTGANWTGAPDLSLYTITLDSPELGVSGKVTFKSIAPPHSPCGGIEAGQNLEAVPHLGWANAVPDALATVDLNVKGSTLAFEGVGYHDKNWADVGLASAVYSWYWGHGRLGPYSIVWFNLISAFGTTTTSSYVSKENKWHSAQCGNIVVRPAGQNDTYPPTPTSGAPSGFNMTIDLGHEGILVAEVENELRILDYPFYRRNTGRLTGSLCGKELPEGVALYEELDLFGTEPHA